MRLFENPSYQFVKNRKTAYIFSGILLLISILAITMRGPELGIDFLGGQEFVVENIGHLDAVEVRGELTAAFDQEPEVRTFGPNALLIRTAVEGETQEIQDALMSQLRASYPDTNPELVMTEIVGPRFAADLARGAIYSIFGALLVIFVYILLRFEWKYSLGAVAALFHDVTITLGIFSLFAGVLPFSLQIDQAIIAAFLTIVGYSLNDTVVVFDRIREYSNLFKTEPFPDMANRSINSTLSRTVVTSVTTLLVVTILFIFGGEVLRGFSFALIIGVIIGTYSSIFVASSVVIELEERSAKAAA